MKTGIRLANYDDMGFLLNIAEAMKNESPRYAELSFSRAKVERIFKHCIESDDGLLIVADGDQGIVGAFAGLISEVFFSDDSCSSDVGLFILPQYRGGTTAMRLIKQYVAWAKMNQVKVIQLGISTGIQVEKTAELYAVLGFEKCSYGFELR